MRKLRNSELNRLSLDEFHESKKLPIRVVLDDVRSLHNVGSIFRICDAFRVSQLVLGGITALPPHPEIEKTALGATESVSWYSASDLVTYLREQPFGELIALEHTSTSYVLNECTSFNKPVTLVFGNEVKGVSNEVLALCQAVYEIPQLGTKHSLNVSVSAGIAIWEFAKAFIK
jgi:tRNA G18 (ribose-2'-O)-methylase SpoU